MCGAEEEPGAVGVVRHRLQLAGHLCRVGPVEHAAVGPRDGGRVERPAPAALELHRVHACGLKLLQVCEHVEVARAEEVGRPPILLHLERLAGPRRLLELPLPAAGLRAVAAVGRPPIQEVGDDAAPRVRHAHAAVRKRLKLQGVGQLGVHGGDVGQRHLAGAHHALGAQGVPGQGRRRVAHARLRAHVQLHLRGMPARQRERPHVGDDERVDARRLRRLKEPGQLGQVGLVHHRVAGKMHLHAAPVGVGAHPGQVGRLEVGGAPAHAEALAGQVHRVGPEPDGVLELLSSTRRCQKFQSIHSAQNRAQSAQTFIHDNDIVTEPLL